MTTAPLIQPETERTGERTGNLCPACSSWLCAGDDAYCSRCGATCAQLNLLVSSAVLPIGSALLPKVRLTVKNPACVRLRVQQWSLPPWLEMIDFQETEIAPGASRIFDARANTSGVKKAQSARVTVFTTIGKATASVMVIPSPPVLAASPAQIEYWPDGPSALRQCEVECYPPEGELRIQQLQDMGSGWLTLQTPVSGPITVSREAPLRVLLQVDPARLPAGDSESFGKKLKTAIGVSYYGVHGMDHLSLPLTLEIRRPPALTLEGEHKPPRVRFQTTGQRLTFKFTNSSEQDAFGGSQNAQLELGSLILTPPAGCNQVNVQLRSPLPLKLDGGLQGEVEFQADLESLEPTMYYFDLKVSTNDHNCDRSYAIPVEVRKLEVFEGVAAIDFGTSNTCFALLADDGTLESIALDDTAPPDKQQVAPTLVRYLDLSGPEPLMETGAAVKHLAAAEEEVASNTLDRLKQSLGEPTSLLPLRPKNPPLWTKREARVAAADYLRHIREVAEKQKNAIFNEFILTHPAVCSLRQYRNLRFALETAFGRDAKVHFLQEPVASLVPFFQEEGRNGTKSPYIVAAFDLGGGTTDITVVRVTHVDQPSGLREITPEILASWGERFGGEDLTDFLVKEVKARCGGLLGAQRPGYRIAEAEVPRASAASIRRNGSALREWADEFKASISEEVHAPKSPEDMLLGVVPDNREQKPELQQFSTQAVCSQGEDLQLVFIRYLSGRLEKLAERLEDALRGVGPLDFLHLSGKTAFLTEVHRVLAERFKTATIQRAADPKECVVRGACLWQSLSRSGRRKMRLALPSSANRTTSEIGIVEDQIFETCIQSDCEIPECGLQAPIASDWDGQSRVVLWENLGLENSLVLPDKSRNPLISRLGSWEPATPAPPGKHSWKVWLRLCPDFSLQVSAVSGDSLIELRPTQAQR